MVRSGLQKKRVSRKTSRSKAKLRNIPEKKSIKLTQSSLIELHAVVTARPRVDFSDPFMRHSAMQAKGISLCAFLVTLAAFQRGLKVTFHYEFASKNEKFRKSIIQGHRGELFTISNGERTHTFSRTLGDMINPIALAAGEDKHLTKATLRRAGVQTPQGIVVSKDQESLVAKFIKNNTNKRFVVKPYDGTLGEGVYTNLLGSEVLEKLALIKSERLIVEEHIEGMEYRVFVAGYRYISCFLRAPANIIGDGQNSIETLISEKNARRKTNPRLVDDLISDFESVSKFLSITGRNLQTIPADGEKVILLPTASILAGGDPVDCTHEIIGDLVDVSEAACKAMEIPISGLDIIVREEGGQKKAYVLELNQRPHINAHSFPMDTAGPGNIVAEAIIDYYFPETVRNRLFPELTYDFNAIRTALQSSQISEVSLPVIGDDWNVMRLRLEGDFAQKMSMTIAAAAKASGVFIVKTQAQRGAVLLCLAYSSIVFTKFIELLPQKIRPFIEAKHVREISL